MRNGVLVTVVVLLAGVGMVAQANDAAIRGVGGAVKLMEGHPRL